MLPFRSKSPDDFQTPPHVLMPLLPFLPRDKVIWEPACGKGNLVRTLRGEGFRVTGTDIKTGTDFLTHRRSAFDEAFRDDPTVRDDFPDYRPPPPPLGGVIVTNPPFSRKDDFIACAYELDLPFALLLPLTALEGRTRQFYFRTFGVELVVLPERVHFETPSGRESHSWFPVAWFCRHLTGRPHIFHQAAGSHVSSRRGS